MINIIIELLCNSCTSMTPHFKNHKDVVKDLHKQISVLKEESLKDKEILKRARKKLKEDHRLATLGKLASAVAHELRNPMGVIRLATYSLKNKISSKDKSLQRHLENIDKKIIESDQIIYNLLAFSRASEIEFEEMDLHKSIKKGLYSVSNHIKEYQVKVIGDFNKNITKVMAGPTQLTEVFYNVFLNAVQSMVESEVRELQVTTRQRGNFVDIKISDTGCGITKRNLKKLGEPFFSTKTKGIGLGLHVIYEIIHKHEGAINVKSKLGKGTTFIISLPLKK